MQVLWKCPDQLRAGTQRDWLNLQLQGRGYIEEDIPRIVASGGAWLTVADIAFDTTAEGDTIKTLCLTRMSADPFIQAGSYVQFHHCDHYDDANTCAVTLQRTVK